MRKFVLNKFVQSKKKDDEEAGEVNGKVDDKLELIGLDDAPTKKDVFQPPVVSLAFQKSCSSGLR